MAYNFKSIADVDVVEELSEEAHVLIEEDGVIKRAPKTVAPFGGGGGGALFITGRSHQQANYTYAEILEAFNSGKILYLTNYTDTDAVQTLKTYDPYSKRFSFVNNSYITEDGIIHFD